MYDTERTVRARIEAALRERRAAQKRPYDPTELQSEAYLAWADYCIAKTRAADLLLTEQQMTDFRARRLLKLDDNVRYIGEDIDQVSPRTGHTIKRPHGQYGSITEVQYGAGDRIIFTFMPNVSRQTLDLAESADVEVLGWTTAAWKLFERIP